MRQLWGYIETYKKSMGIHHFTTCCFFVQLTGKSHGWDGHRLWSSRLGSSPCEDFCSSGCSLSSGRGSLEPYLKNHVCILCKILYPPIVFSTIPTHLGPASSELSTDFVSFYWILMPFFTESTFSSSCLRSHFSSSWVIP